VLRPAVGALTPAETVGLMVGTVLILGCFVMGQSVEYRAVHLLFVLPLLLALAGPPGRAGRVARFTLWVILLQLWGDVASAPLFARVGTSPSDAAAAVTTLLWLVRELAWWWIAAMLLALLLALVPDLPCLAARRGVRR
jgi:hypothetical protein